MVLFSFVTLFAFQVQATVYKINCYLADDRNGDRTLISYDDMLFDTESEVQRPTVFQHELSKHSIKFDVNFDHDEDLIYLGIEDLTDKVRSSSVTDGSMPVYTRLGTEHLELFAGCEFEYEAGDKPKKKRKKSKSKKSQGPKQN